MSRRSILMMGAVVALVLVVLPALASAQATTGTVTKTGSLAADQGGAENSWVIKVPDGDTATFTLTQTNLPCFLGSAPRRSLHTEYRGVFGMKVMQWNKVGYGVETGQGGCKQTLEFTSAGGDATLVVFNYQPGFTADYSLTMEGVTVEAAPVAAAAAAEAQVPAKEPATGRGF